MDLVLCGSPIVADTGNVDTTRDRATMSAFKLSLVMMMRKQAKPRHAGFKKPSVDVVAA
jgi:hypothetical protein